MHDLYRKVALQLSDASLNGQGVLRLKVTSQSMAPLLRPGDYILVESTPLDKIRRGDLIVTRREDDYLTHRLVAKSAQGWLTKGDQNSQADAPVEVREVVGLVVAYVRLGKLHSLRTRYWQIIAWLQGWLGWQEIACHSKLGKGSVRIISRALRFLCS